MLLRPQKAAEQEEAKKRREEKEREKQQQKQQQAAQQPKAEGEPDVEELDLSDVLERRRQGEQSRAANDDAPFVDDGTAINPSSAFALL